MAIHESIKREGKKYITRWNQKRTTTTCPVGSRPFDSREVMLGSQGHSLVGQFVSDFEILDLNEFRLGGMGFH